MKTISCLLLVILSIFDAHSQDEDKTMEKLWISTEFKILRGVIDYNTISELYVGQPYFFSVVVNDPNYDIVISSTNLKVKILDKNDRSTGGYMLQVIPLDTGDCRISVSVGKDKVEKSGLGAYFFHASNYPMPPVWIGDVRSGNVITELANTDSFQCKYGSAQGIFSEYPILSWKAFLGDKEYTGSGSEITKELIEAVNQAKANEVLHILMDLEKNDTGFKQTEGVFLLK